MAILINQFFSSSDLHKEINFSNLKEIPYQSTLNLKMQGNSIPPRFERKENPYHHSLNARYGYSLRSNRGGMGFPCVQTVVVWVFLAFKPWWYGFSLRPKCGGQELINKNDLPYRRDRDSLDFLYPRASQTCPRVKKIQAVPLSSIRYIPDPMKT